MGILDGSIIFFLPLGIDFVVILMAARHPTMFWLYALLGALGSVLGAAGTFWMGRKAGEKGIIRFVQPRQLERVKRSVTRGSYLVAAMGMIPPPFPFTPFVLAAGALEVRTMMFFITLTACRLFRFGLETALALLYGRRILTWLDSDIFHDIVTMSIVLAIVLTIVSIVQLVRSTSPSRKRGAPA
jgi:membrane protein YqaA with SNARE-associated domain